jgi:hypothetical protein
MRSFSVVITSPLLALDASLGERREQRLVQELVAQSIVEALDEGVLLGLPGVYVVPVEAKALRPAHHYEAIDRAPSWQPAPSSSRITRPPGREVLGTRHRLSRV